MSATATTASTAGSCPSSSLLEPNTRHANLARMQETAQSSSSSTMTEKKKGQARSLSPTAAVLSQTSHGMTRSLSGASSSSSDSDSDETAGKQQHKRHCSHTRSYSYSSAVDTAARKSAMGGPAVHQRISTSTSRPQITEGAFTFNNNNATCTSFESTSSAATIHARPSSASSGVVEYVKIKIDSFCCFMGIGTGEWTEKGRLAVPERLGAYIPILIWALTSILMAVIVGCFHKQVFEKLDELSVYLKSIGIYGNLILFSLIFITTFPPLPLYSTLIVLSGYSFGLWKGFLISYCAALSGAVFVFLLSKTFFRQYMQKLLDKSRGFRNVLIAIEKRPSLLWLIRLSPYPYNVMNTLLASSNTLSFSCYFWCTALALPKLLIHCGIGTTLRTFTSPSEQSNSPSSSDGEDEDPTGQTLHKVAGGIGLLLCLSIFFYILYIAKKAIREECALEESSSSHQYRTLDLSSEQHLLSETNNSSLESIEVHTHQEMEQLLHARQRPSSAMGNFAHSFAAPLKEREREMSARSSADYTLQHPYGKEDSPFLASSRKSLGDVPNTRPAAGGTVHRHVFERQDSNWPAFTESRTVDAGRATRDDDGRNRHFEYWSSGGPAAAGGGRA